jgi:hypothetical protein
MRAHTIATCTGDVYDKMEPAVSVHLCSAEHDVDGAVHVINCIKTYCYSLIDSYVTLFHALFSSGRNGGVHDRNKVMED